jgi:hypothetical protein
MKNKIKLQVHFRQWNTNLDLDCSLEKLVIKGDKPCWKNKQKNNYFEDGAG